MRKPGFVMELTSHGHHAVHPCGCACHFEAGYKCGGKCCVHQTAKDAVKEHHERVNALNERALRMAREAYKGKDVHVFIDQGCVIIESKSREFMQAAPVTFPDEDPDALERLLKKWDARHDSKHEEGGDAFPKLTKAQKRAQDERHAPPVNPLPPEWR